MAGDVHGRGVCMAEGMHGRGACIAAGACMAGEGMHDKRDGHCSGRYASYWNAFLLRNCRFWLYFKLFYKLFKEYLNFLMAV